MLDTKDISKRIDSNDYLSSEEKTELKELLYSLDEELKKTDAENVEHIAGIERIKEVIPHAASKSEKTEEVLDAVAVFETTHPKITMLIDRICQLLSNTGI